MTKIDKKQTALALERVEKAINDIKNNDFTLYFFVVDSKNVPNGSISYIYQLAKTLNDKGYNCEQVFFLDEREKEDILADYHEALFENWVDEELIACDMYE